MACSSCGGGGTRRVSMPKAGTQRPTAMKSANKIFQHGPYGSKVSKQIIGRVPASLKIKKR